ncbi:MAG: FAD-dependent oxidoreductase [Geminicoccales bacterium]
MLIGIPKEIKDNENRVSTTPAGVAEYVAQGHGVLVETSAGTGSGFSDDEYRGAGAQLIDSAAEIWQRAEMIVKVKEPIEPEYLLMQDGQILYTYLHLAAEEHLTHALMERGVTAVAYETVELADGSLPLLSPMSEVAGRMATQVGAHYLAKYLGGRGKLLGGVPGVPPADVVIIGGGVIGSAVAYFLLSDAGFEGRVTVIERDPSYKRASSALSASSIRQQFSTPENIRMSMFGAQFVKSIAEHLSVDDEKAELPFVENGYLFLATEAGLPVLRDNHVTQTALGADIAFLGPDALEARFPWLNVDGVAAGTFGLSNEGWTDPYGLLQAFRRKARSLGVEYVKDELVDLRRDGGRVVAVQLAAGGEIACGTLVDAAGFHAGAVAALAGLELPVRPRKRYVFVFDCREKVEKAPLLIDPNGVYFRPEGASYICGVSPPADADPDSLDFEIDYGLFEETVWPTLAHRVPAFEAIKLARAWAGHYDYNTLDQNAVVGCHPEVANLYVAAGFSGHGLQQSPAIGRAVAELIVEGAYRSIDLTRFGWERVLRNAPIFERNVV